MVVDIEKEVSIVVNQTLIDTRKCLTSIIDSNKEELFNNDLIDLDNNLTKDGERLLCFFSTKYNIDIAHLIVLSIVYHDLVELVILKEKLIKHESEVEH